LLPLPVFGFPVVGDPLGLLSKSLFPVGRLKIPFAPFCVLPRAALLSLPAAAPPCHIGCLRRDPIQTQTGVFFALSYHLMEALVELAPHPMLFPPITFRMP